MKKFLLALALCCLALPAFACDNSAAKGAGHEHDGKSCACAHKGEAPSKRVPPAFTPSSDFAPAPKGCDQAQKEHCQAGHCEKDCKSTECKSCCGDEKAQPTDHAHHH